MHADNAWLAGALSEVEGLDPRCNTNVHFQYAFSPRSQDVAAVFQRHGIGVRVLSVAHGVQPDALRIVAPRVDERSRFAAAVADVREELAGALAPLQSDQSGPAESRWERHRQDDCAQSSSKGAANTG
jgi:histidinol-phosphate/aromatic aminotransferase/cobyric acid decarboxylase-like protein